MASSPTCNKGDSYDETLTEWKGTMEWTFGMEIFAQSRCRHAQASFVYFHHSGLYPLQFLEIGSN